MVAVCSGALAAKGRGRGVRRGPRVSLNAAVRAVYCGNVTELGGCFLVEGGVLGWARCVFE